ncbi:MAG: hypothetical protein U9Q63_00750 [Patescibacteria group bacterium]|nr:hypothetical protein [Patescibacteria group bacterium]
MIKSIKLATIFIAIFILSSTSIKAVNRMESESYKLKFTNLNMTSGSKESSNFKVLDTIGQFAPGQYSSSGYYVKAGFPYIKTIIAFSFTISDLSIDFSTLPLNTLTTKTNTLSVSCGGAGGYSVSAIADHPLKLQASATTIPDTTCNTSCDESTADVWTSTDKYGFGFNMTGDDIASDFTDSTYFRQFADLASTESPQIIMLSSNVGTNRTATVTYQANISGSQAAGDYENQITYTAVPSY